MPSSTKLSIYLGNGQEGIDLEELLKKKAKQAEVSVSELIVLAIKEYLEE